MSLAVAGARWALASGAHTQPPATMAILLTCPCTSTCGGKDNPADINWKVIWLTQLLNASSMVNVL